MFFRYLWLLLITCVIGYLVIWLVRSTDRFDWGVLQRSNSIPESKEHGFYIGTYTPMTHRIVMRNGVAEIPDAWVEHGWKPELNVMLQEKRNPVSGYFLHIPIRFSEIKDDREGCRIVLKLDKESVKYSSKPGIGFSPHPPDQGFVVYLDTLPKTIGFLIEEPMQAGWKTPIVTGTIQFGRDLNEEGK